MAVRTTELENSPFFNMLFGYGYVKELLLKLK